MRQPVLPQWRRPKPMIGMVHLLPLPGAPRWQGSFQQVLDRAASDAAALAEGGIDAIIVENYGDTPFFPGRVPPETVAAVTAAVIAVRNATDLPIGVNMLRNDAAAALGIATVTGAAFIRVNVHTGAMLTDQGWLSGAAHETLRTRAALGANVGIFADVLVKHATAPAGLSLEDAARDTWHRGHADALIISGSGTGEPTGVDDVHRAKTAVPAATILIGSGLTAANAAELLAGADGAIVGSAVKTDGRPDSPVSADRVRRLIDVVERIRG